jgi:hypothetical protein
MQAPHTHMTRSDLVFMRVDDDTVLGGRTGTLCRGKSEEKKRAHRIGRELKNAPLHESTAGGDLPKKKEKEIHQCRSSNGTCASANAQANMAGSRGS